MQQLWRRLPRSVIRLRTWTIHHTSGALDHLYEAIDEPLLSYLAECQCMPVLATG